MEKMRYIGNTQIFLEKQEKVGYGYNVCQKQSLILTGPGLRSSHLVGICHHDQKPSWAATKGGGKWPKLLTSLGKQGDA